MPTRTQRGIIGVACLLTLGAAAITFSALGARRPPAIWSKPAFADTSKCELAYVDARRIGSIACTFKALPIKTGSIYTAETFSIQIADGPTAPAAPRADGEKQPTREQVIQSLRERFDTFVSNNLPQGESGPEPTSPPSAALFDLARAAPGQDILVEFPARIRHQTLAATAGYTGLIGLVLILLALALAAWTFYLWQARLRALSAGGCTNCGYNLYGINADRCPECGALQD